MPLMFTSFASASLVSELRICGNYCGPGWCGGKRERFPFDCDTSVPALSCNDECCRNHDVCCERYDYNRSISGPKASCNRGLLDCLTECTDGNEADTCLSRDGYPVPGVLITVGLQPVADWCCGAPCEDSPTDAQDNLLPFDFVSNQVQQYFTIGRGNGAFGWETRHLRLFALVWLACFGAVLLLWCATFCRHRRFVRTLRHHGVQRAALPPKLDRTSTRSSRMRSEGHLNIHMLPLPKILLTPQDTLLTARTPRVSRLAGR